MTTRISIATALALATGLLHAVGQDTSKSPSANEPSANEPSADQVEFFETKVSPILVDH